METNEWDSWKNKTNAWLTTWEKTKCKHWLEQQNVLQRDFFCLINNTRSMKLISYCRKAQWVKRCEESVSVLKLKHKWKTERNHFKEDRNMFDTCSGHILTPQITFTTHELSNALEQGYSRVKSLGLRKRVSNCWKELEYYIQVGTVSESHCHC